MLREPLEVGLAPITIADVVDVSRGGRKITVSGELEGRVRDSRDFVERWIRDGKVAYGVNTGFGSLATVRISHGEIEHLQVNLLRSHAAGVGEPLSEELVRAMLFLRAVALLQGCSGIRFSVIVRLLDMLERRIHPVVPCQGSVGASGDLAPLAHLALALIGEGEVFHQGCRVPSAEALRAEGLEPLTLEAKEGLALINGTQAMAAHGCLALADLGVALRSADVTACMSLEALMGTDASLHPMLHEARRQQGQIASADNMRRIVAGSPLISSHRDCDRVQDAYSLRCAPQVHGAARDVYRWACGMLEREINAVTDNPLVFPEIGGIVSGGNFHGAPVALALDCVAMAPIYLCNISERRTYRLLDRAVSGLPAFLTERGGLHSGLMLAQYTAAALTSENKTLAWPASADTIPTSAGQEDHVSMGMGSARKLMRLVEHAFQVLGIEALCAAQALEMREPTAFGPGTQAALKAIRGKFRPVDEDRVLSGDLQGTAHFLRSGALVRAVEAACGAIVG